MNVIRPENAAQAAEAAAEILGAGRALIPAGGLSRLGQWPRLGDENISILSCGAMKKVLELAPENLSATVEAGLTPAELDEILSPLGLYCPVGGPLTWRRSLGAVTAEGWPGAEALARGQMNDWVLGLTMLEPGGRLVKSGGRTLKNVSGYDLTRILWKSWGRLGLAASFTLKLLPRPQKRLALLAPLGDSAKAVAAVERLLTARLGLAGLRMEMEDGFFRLRLSWTGFEEFVSARAARARELVPELEFSEADFLDADPIPEHWPIVHERLGMRRASRRGLLSVMSLIFRSKASMLRAEIDFGGGLLRTLWRDSRPYIVPRRFRDPLVPGEGDLVFQRLKAGLDPDDRIFPFSILRGQARR